MPFYNIATAAASWSEDRNGSFLISWDHPGQVDPEVNTAWHNFVLAMQALGDCGEDNEVGGHLYWFVQADHPELGRAVVAWSSHVEGRGPCNVEVVPLFSTQREVCPGPCSADQPGALLAEYIANGTWQYTGDPAAVGLPQAE